MSWLLNRAICSTPIPRTATSPTRIIQTESFAPAPGRKRTNIKAQLAFARLTQDCDDEGCFYLDRLPTQAEAGPVRDALGIRKRRHLSPEEATAAALNFRRAKLPDLATEIVPEAEDGQIPIQMPYEQK